MNKFLLALFIAFLCNFSISAQTQGSRLISIDLDKVNDLNILEFLELPVYHLYDNILISAAIDEKIQALKDSKIVCSVIDKDISASAYYLISTKNKIGKLPNSSSENIIFNYGMSAIIKNPASIESLVSNGFNVTEILELPVLFKNERLLNSVAAILDTSIQNVVSSVSADSVTDFIQSLQNFQTRFLLASNRDSVSRWIKYQFERFGFTDVELDSFQYSGTWQTNVIATLHGTVMPERVFVFGGHHDSYSSGNPSVFAPGADDNASGTAAILEIARVMKLKNYQPDCTIKFATFAAEEYGLWGSKHMAEEMLSQGVDVRLMINHDMISHTYGSAQGAPVDINGYTGSEAYSNLAKQMVQTYSILNPFSGGNNSSGSDSYSFWQRGYNAVYFEEREFSPYYHSPQDIISNYNMPFCAEVIKSSGALLLTTNKMPAEVKNYLAFDMGTGSDVKLVWSKNSEQNLAGYKIRFGISSGVYDTTISVTDTINIVSNLMDGIKHYLGVSAYKTDGTESFVVERSLTPRSIPAAPQELYATPLWQSIKLTWAKNNELDLLGYNIYKSTELNGVYSKINSSVLLDTSYSDFSTASGQFYYYYISAVDNQQNEGPASLVVISRAITLDKGILIVDETADGTGGLLSPTDIMVDEFYNTLLSGYEKTHFDFATEGTISLTDVAPYSTIIWHGDDYNNYPASSQIISVIKQYLDFGGNLLYSGYRPARLFGGSSSGGAKYLPGSFLHDYLKIDSSLYRTAARFTGGVPLDITYPHIYTDSTKTFPNLNYHLIGVESIIAASTGSTTYKYETAYDSTTSFGSMIGQSIAVEYLGGGYNIVILSFPLYYMHSDAAALLVNNVLQNKFGEVTDIQNEIALTTPKDYFLEQNYPNPFNPTTVIKYQIPSAGNVQIKVYDILGNLAATLVNEAKEAGRYELKFDASRLSSGTYFYTIIANGFVQTKKMLLIK